MARFGSPVEARSEAGLDELEGEKELADQGMLQDASDWNSWLGIDEAGLVNVA
ncbi:MAG: hypothetical protein AAFV72_03190 [Cyanobacteria bacterium J06635_1]